MNSPENNLISIFTHKEISSLYKLFLEIIEDIEVDHKEMMKKVTLKSGEEFSDSIDYLSPSKQEQIRKRILDQGNSCSRTMISFLGYFDFIINKEKVEKSAEAKRVITKKVTTNSVISVE